MAVMYNCGVDWTYDLAYEDAKKASALPLPRGVHRRCENDGVALFTYMKTAVKRTISDTPWDDSWEEGIDWSFVSDWYKDAYGQRPHFGKWDWRGLLGVYQPFMGFGFSVEDSCKNARYMREHLASL